MKKVHVESTTSRRFVFPLWRSPSAGARLLSRAPRLVRRLGGRARTAETVGKPITFAERPGPWARRFEADARGHQEPATGAGAAIGGGSKGTKQKEARPTQDWGVPGFRLLLTVVAPKGSWQTGCHFQPLRIRTPKRSGGSDAKLDAVPVMFSKLHGCGTPIRPSLFRRALGRQR